MSPIFWCPIGPWMESSDFTGTNNLYVKGFDDYVITEMINMLCNEQWSMSPICA